jgi:MFS family permease
VAENVYYVIGFPLAGLTAAWFFRVVGLSRILAGTMAILFAIAPYHFVRNESHLWYSEYYLVPLAMVLLYRVVNGVPLWGTRPGSHFARGIFTGRGAQTVVILALFGTQNTQFAVFAILILAIIGTIALIRTHAWRRFVGAAMAGLVLVVVLLINLAPPLVYTAINGDNVQAVARTPVRTYDLSLRISDLVLPMTGDRINTLNIIRVEYDKIFGSNEDPALGLVASIGFLIALVVVFALIVVRRRRDRSVPVRDRFRTNALAILSILTLVALLISMVGGLSFLLSFITSDIRGWNRISIFIALLSLGVMGVAIDYCVVRFGGRFNWSRARRAIIAAAVSVILVVVGFFDQTAPVFATPHYAANNTRFSADARFVSTIEKSVPKGAAILQLPYQRFPETAAVRGVSNSDQLMPFLHTSTLRWSGAGDGHSSTGRASSLVCQ